jgi:hypothetical protein
MRTPYPAEPGGISSSRVGLFSSVAIVESSMIELTLHERFIRQAIGLAATNPRAPFAAVLVDIGTGAIVAKETNRGKENPTEVVIGTSIRTLKQLGWKQIDITAEEVTRRTPFAHCRLIGGVLEGECDELFRSATAITGERTS